MPAPAPLEGVKRVLVLHGYMQNAVILSKRLDAIRRVCGSKIEFCCLDAPIVLKPTDAESYNDNPQAVFDAINPTNDPTLAPRAWWNGSRLDAGVKGLENTFSFLRDILSREKLDGVLGFSQGATLAAILSAMLERPENYPNILINGLPPHPPFEFCVAMSGFKHPDPYLSSILDATFNTRTLHVIGRRDTLTDPAMSFTLVDVSLNRRVEMHDWGHIVPWQDDWPRFLFEWIMDPNGDVPAPKVSGMDDDVLSEELRQSASNSGAKTSLDSSDSQVGGAALSCQPNNLVAKL
ncbi:hypothetical protein HGRIS_001913 [Hohenbuehelia grisea]|uniref:Serine hydrolase domain-containing protein n=1 Tax=Hohenbuehelia grisea TaxID=104357 RepID=A0ABR3JJB7_9AGAR